MPYIVTTKRPDARTCECDPLGEGLDHHAWCGRADGSKALLTASRAVATLEEARIEVRTAVPSEQYAGHVLHATDALPESGGTVGPLPDGTVIEVEHVAEATLRQMLPADVRQRVMYGDTVAAFNAREARR